MNGENRYEFRGHDLTSWIEWNELVRLGCIRLRKNAPTTHSGS